MALNPETKYPGRITAGSTGYPYGSSKDETSPGAGDGTPYEQGRANDIFGFQQALLKSRGIVPTGNADAVRASQYLQAVMEYGSGAANYLFDTGAANAYVLGVANADSQGATQYFDGMVVAFRPTNTNTGASTINVTGLGVVNIKTKYGTDPGAGALTAGKVVQLIWDDTNSWFEILEFGGSQMLGNAATKGIFYNANTIDENITVPANINAGSFGPIEVTGTNVVDVTAAGATWSIVGA